MKKLENMTFAEMEAEIKAFEAGQFDPEENYVFISYSHKDKEYVARTVLGWIRNGYNVYIDYDFENHGSDDNWVDIMYDKIASSSCVMVVCFLSEDYYYSYAALIELLTMRSKTIIEYRNDAENDHVPIDILLVDKKDDVGNKITMVKSGADFSSDEVKKRYKEVEFAKLRKNMGKTFLESKNQERIKMEEGFSSLCDNKEDVEKNMQYLMKAYSTSSSDFYKKIANYMIKWFNKWNLNGNQKSSLDGVKKRFENLEVYRREVEESTEEAITIMSDVYVLEREDIAEVSVTKEQDEISVEAQTKDTEEKIGAYVRESMLRLIEANLLTEELVENLQDEAWSKDVLHLSYPVLLKLMPDKDISDQIADEKGRARYWAKSYTIRGDQYCICNDWYEKHRTYFEQFLAQVEAGVVGETASNRKKNFSLTGDVTYSLYGKEYTENQSDMMLRFFAQVLNRHQDIIDDLPAYEGMNCVSKTDYTLKENVTEDMKSYFRNCQYFKFDSGKSICVGTAYSLGDKLKKMAQLLKIVGEDNSIFSSEQVELPVIKDKVSKSTADNSESSGRGAKVKFTVFGESYEANQVNMLGIVFSKFIEKYPNLLEKIAEEINCVDLVDYTLVNKEERPVAFKSSFNAYEISGKKYSVGGGYNMGDKAKMIVNLVKICNESENSVEIDGVELKFDKVKTATRSKEKSFL